MKASRKKEWFDNDAFWRELFPIMFPDSRFAATAGEVRQVLKLAKPPGKRALDLCCGPGRCSIALARRGFSVTGVDRTRFLLAEARRRARAARVRIEWVRADMRDFVRPGTYDLVLSMFTSFGYFDDKRQDLVVLKNMLASLRPDGACVIEVMGKEVLARIFEPTTSDAHADGSRLMQRHEVFDDWTRIRNEWTLVRRGRARTWEFHHTVYSGQELRNLMEEVGFTDVRLYGALDGSAYDRKATRLVAVGRKPRPRRLAPVRGAR